jgi:hypothetical protein
MLGKGKQFLPFIRQLSCYSYIQSIRRHHYAQQAQIRHHPLYKKLGVSCIINNNKQLNVVLHCLSFFLLAIVLSVLWFKVCLPLWYLLAIVLSVLRFKVCLPLWYLLAIVLSVLRFKVCLPLWYILAIVLSVLRFKVSVYLFGIFWPLYCLSFDLRFLFTSLVSFGHCIVGPSI